MYGETITILRSGAGTGDVDEQGNPIPGAETSIESDGWAVAPATAAESSEPFAQQIVIGYTLYKRNVIEDIRSTDRIVVRGKTWAVTGQPGEWEHPRSHFQGTVANVKAVG